MDALSQGLLIAVGAAVLLIWLPWLALGFNSWAYLRRERPTQIEYVPSVALIAPCRGVDQGFEDNVRAVLSQDYPNFRVVFVTGTTEDPAYPVLARLIQDCSNARLLVAGPARNRGQKVHNLLAAVASVPEVDVLAFVDSDVRPHPTWLRSLIAPLADAEVGGTSGYLRYRPERGGIWSWTRAYCVALSSSSMVRSGNRSLWGGAMAVRRDVFERAGVAHAWQQAISDDIILARQIKRLGLKLVCVPQCLTDAVEDCDLSGFWEYLVRHLITARVCDIGSWLLLGSVLALPAVSGLAGSGLLLISILYPQTFWPGVVLLVQLPLMVIYTAPLCSMVMNDRRLAWAAPLTLLVAPLTIASFVVSAFTRRITWRGIKYDLLSANETRLLASSETAGSRTEANSPAPDRS